MKLEDLGEFALIERLRALAGPTPEGVRLGIGDDAAVFRPAAGYELVLTCDTHLDGRHFLLSRGDPAQIGRRVAVANLSDIAAMGATPLYALLALGLPGALSVEVIETLYRGLVQEFQAHEATIIGGNITATEGPLFVDVFLMGQAREGEAVGRNGAQPGDWIGVTGYPGQAGAGLLLLQQGLSSPTPAQQQLLHAYHHPQARLAESSLLAPVANAMIDLSDGLLADLQHILEQSHVGACLQQERLPISPALKEVAPLLDLSGEELLFGSSDDYELLCCVPPSLAPSLAQQFLQQTKTPLHWLGEITPQPGELSLQQLSGNHIPLTSRGWDHFKASS